MQFFAFDPVAGKLSRGPRKFNRFNQDRVFGRDTGLFPEKWNHFFFADNQNLGTFQSPVAYRPYAPLLNRTTC